MATTKRPEHEILADLRSVDSCLEPEYLFADGERPRSEARKLEKKLNSQRKKLVKELGREPTSKELWS